MNEKKLSVVIPSYKDPLLHKTIDSLWENSELGDQLEIIVVLDRYWPVKQIKSDPRIKIIHLGANHGMRGAINSGMAIARGEFVARCDEHIMFSPGYDKVLTESCGDKDMMTGRRFFLNPEKWEIMKELPPVEHEKLVIQGGKKFAGQRWASRDLEQKDVMISETLACQGSFWILPRKIWNGEIKELQTDGYGPLIQDSHEVSFKVWKAGGRMMINKAMWYAHKHRSFKRCHNNGTPENPANCDAGYKYALDTWGEYYQNVIRKKWKI